MSCFSGCIAAIASCTISVGFDGLKVSGNPAEGRTFLRTLRNSKPCVYVFCDGFCHGICFSTSKELWTFTTSKM